MRYRDRVHAPRACWRAEAWWGAGMSDPDVYDRENVNAEGDEHGDEERRDE